MNDQSPGDSTQVIGKWMLWIGWLLILAVLSIYFHQQEKEQINPNQQVTGINHSGFKEIALERNRAGHYVLTALVNGTPIDFLIDTGASDLVFTADQAKLLQLPQGLQYPVQTANGSIYVTATTVDRIELGNIALNNIHAAINPHMTGVALLGMSALSNLDWSQVNNRLIIRQYH